jgi:hypothetical protein
MFTGLSIRRLDIISVSHGATGTLKVVDKMKGMGDASLSISKLSSSEN